MYPDTDVYTEFTDCSTESLLNSTAVYTYGILNLVHVLVRIAEFTQLYPDTVCTRSKFSTVISVLNLVHSCRSGALRCEERLRTSRKLLYNFLQSNA